MAFLIILLFSKIVFGSPKPEDRKLIMSLHVVHCQTGKTLYEKNPHQSLIPASITKLITAAAILETYGAWKQWSTPFAHDSSLKQGILQGPLFVKGMGQILRSEDLWRIASDLYHLGLRQVPSLVIDHGIFPPSPKEAAHGENKNRSYGAVVTGFSTHFNTYPVLIAKRLDEEIFCGIDPYPIPGLNLTSEISHESKKKIHVENLHGSLSVRGELGSGPQIHRQFPAMKNPLQETGEVLASFLRERGMMVQSISLGKFQGKTFYECPGKTTGELIREMNLYSNNLLADSLMRLLPLSRGEEGSLERGRDFLTKYFQNQTSEKFFIPSGSGLDVQTRLTTKSMTDLLVKITKKPYFPEFLSSLPSAGESGFLRKRLEPLKGFFRAKTGLLSEPASVTSLGGYFFHPKKGLIAVGAIINSTKHSTEFCRNFLDQEILKLWVKLQDF